MSVGLLTELQVRVLRTLTTVTPAWTLTGGAALAGFYTAHRTTRDLDLFWQGLDALGSLPSKVEDTLRAAGFAVDVLQAAPAFHRLRVQQGDEVVVVDLVSLRRGWIETPAVHTLGDVSLHIDTPHQILVNKLTALLSRAELRDLEDVRVLLAHSGDLHRALVDAAQVDGGFSPLTLAWVLETFPLPLLATRQGRGSDDIASLEAFRHDLIERVSQAAASDAV